MMVIVKKIMVILLMGFLFFLKRIYYSWIVREQSDAIWIKGESTSLGHIYEEGKKERVLRESQREERVSEREVRLRRRL